MRITIFGLGYVGCVSAACLAQDRHAVHGVDINPHKVEQINSGSSPIIEPGLAELVQKVVQGGTLSASSDGYNAVLQSDISLICVGTPSNPNGSLNTRHVESVCKEIGRALKDIDHYHVVVVRSTVLPGTIESMLIPILETESGRRAGTDFGICMNPEFLRESTAIADYYQPCYIVIGEMDERSGNAVVEMYGAIETEIFRVSIPTAEMIKYANNAFHATKVVFANEIGSLSKALGVDGQEVMRIVCEDRQLNISPVYLRPGYAFGGSCLPKDLRALLYKAKEHDESCPMLNAVLPSNQQHIQRGIAMVERTGRKKVGVLGLSFKSGTDDVRESPIVPLIETLVGRGYDVSVFDEHVVPELLVGANRVYLERELPHIASLMRTSVDEVLEQAEVVVMTSGSKAFRDVPQRIRTGQVLIDLAGAGRTAEIEGEYDGICW